MSLSSEDSEGLYSGVVKSSPTATSSGISSGIENPMNILQKAASSIQQNTSQFSNQAVYGAANNALFGLPGMIESKTGFKMSPGEPDSMAGQAGRIVGDIGGYMAGGPEMLAEKAAGGIANPLIRAATKGAVGMGSFSPANMLMGSSPQNEGLKAAGGAALGGIGEGLFNGVFKKNIANEDLQGYLSEISKAKDAIKNDPNATYDSTDLYKNLDNIYNNLAPPMQKKAGVLKQWVDTLRDSHMQNQSPMVQGDMIRQMESDLGHAGKYSGEKAGFMQFVRPKNPVTNQAFKEGRTAASDAYDKLAVQQGYSNFPQQSKNASDILKKWPDLDPSRTSGGGLWSLIKPALAGAGMGALTHNPIAGIGGAIAEKMLESPELKQQAFEFASNPLLAAAARGGYATGMNSLTDTKQ